MKDGAPTELIVPQVLASTTFMVDGEKIDIEQPESYAAYVWIPSAKTILGTGVARVSTSGRQTPRRQPAARSGNRRWKAWRHISLNA